MGSSYNGSVEGREESTNEKKKFNWAALGIWLSSLVISLLPVYAFLLTWLGQKEVLDWEFAFECITQYDVLWTFSTVLLFSLFNCYVSGRAKKKGIYTFLLNVGRVLFVFMEITWYVFKYNVKSFTYWPIALGMILIVCSLIISTPLQIDFIKSEG